MTVSDAFGSTFAAFSNAQNQAKNCKRASKPSHNDMGQTINGRERRAKA